MERRIHTRQKAAIRDAFLEADRPLSPDEVLEGAQRNHPALGKATVYRNIQSLVDEGWLESIDIPGDSTRYEVAGKAHHHHFQCNQSESSMSWRDVSLRSSPSSHVASALPGTSSFFTASVLTASRTF
jgi:Fur family ferric uptake transcriptional regulator